MQHTGQAWTNNATYGPANQGKSVFRWSLDKVVDVNGNETILNYTTDANLLYLTNITCNGNVNDGTISARNTVDFALTTNRSDKTFSFPSGYRVETRNLLSEIVVKANGNLARRFVLSYTNSPSTLRALLDSVTTFGWEDSVFPPQKFSCPVKPFEFEAKQSWTDIIDQGGGSAWGYSARQCK